MDTSEDTRSSNGRHLHYPVIEDLKFAINWNRLSLELVGIWPGPQCSKKTKSAFKFRLLLSVFMIMSFICIPQMTSLVYVWGDLNLTVENLIVANIPCSTVLMEIFVFLYHRKELELLVAHLIEDWKNRKSEEERSTMLRSAKTARTITIFNVCLTCFTGTALISAYLITQLQKRPTGNGTEPIRTSVFQSRFPFDAYTSPGYEVVFVGQSVAIYPAVISYSGIDSFISMLVLHLCGQFETLRGTLKRTVTDAARNREEWRFRKELAAAVMRHIHLNKCAESIEDSFNQVLLIQILGSSVQFCLLGFQILHMLNDDQELPAMQLIFFILFILVIGLHTYVYCYIGEKLSIESMAISDIVYESPWYDLKMKNARDFIIIMCESQRPLTISAGKFFTLSMKQFSDVVTTSMGYLSVLLAMESN